MGDEGKAVGSASPTALLFERAVYVPFNFDCANQWASLQDAIDIHRPRKTMAACSFGPSGTPPVAYRQKSASSILNV
jgi:hypothetical protein